MPKALRLPIGYDIFSSLIGGGFDFIDKTLLIKEIFADPATVMLITRPRRFGKTLNLPCCIILLRQKLLDAKLLGFSKI
jgi:hypothetical protein